VDDEQLRERIRAKLGHVIDRSSAIEVEVHGGQVVLRGDVLNGEMDAAVETIAVMHGVRGIVTHLSPAASADTPSVARETRPMDTQEAQSRREVQH
jgi:osmotically-inducible protein OsmY